jgi:uncharacterized RDD family membrane protein YckC
METPCPLCGREKYMRKGKPLYGRHVCKKCYYGFANRRQLAFVIDSVIFRFGAIAVGLGVGTMLVMLHVSEDLIGALTLPLDLGLTAMFLCKDGMGGRSPGRWLCGVCVIDNRSGEPIGLGASLKRNLPLLIPFIPLVVAAQLCKGVRWGDGWAHSKVIWTKYADHPLFAVAANGGVETDDAQQAVMAELASMPPLKDDANPYRSPRMLKKR